MSPLRCATIMVGAIFLVTGCSISDDKSSASGKSGFSVDDESDRADVDVGPNGNEDSNVQPKRDGRGGLADGSSTEQDGEESVDGSSPAPPESESIETTFVLKNIGEYSNQRIQTEPLGNCGLQPWLAMYKGSDTENGQFFFLDSQCRTGKCPGACQRGKDSCEIDSSNPEQTGNLKKLDPGMSRKFVWSGEARNANCEGAVQFERGETLTAKFCYYSSWIENATVACEGVEFEYGDEQVTYEAEPPS